VEIADLYTCGRLPANLDAPAIRFGVEYKFWARASRMLRGVLQEFCITRFSA
jgi:hypothetical protein